LKTILFVQVVPYIVVSFGGSLAISLLFVPFFWKRGASFSSTYMVWSQFLSTLFTSGLFLAKDIVFFMLSRKTLFRAFRDYAIRGESPVMTIPPPIQPAIPQPPVISSPAT
jgi:hypothetical protein